MSGNRQQKILIVGLFLNETNQKKIARTAADQLAELLNKYGYNIIKVSSIVNPIARLFDTISTIIFSSLQYKIAVVPLYGTPKSFLWSDISIFFLRLLKKKIILILHGGSIPERMKNESTKFLRVMRSVDAVVCPSEFLVRVTKQYDIDSLLIENVINLNEYTFNKKETFRPRLFWMRTFEDIYNPQMAVRVAAIIAKRFPDFKMVMAGHDAGALTSTKQLINQLKLQDQIELVGYITSEQKNIYAKEFDFYLCTNRVDNAPVSVIEMMALGLPVISVNSGGLPYLIKHEQSGLLVNIDDDEAMADAIISILENAEKGRHLAAYAKHVAAQYDEVPVALKWQKLFANWGHAIPQSS